MAVRSHHLSLAGFDASLVEALLDSALLLPARPAVLGITGLQGCGKSTLALQLVRAGRQRGLTVAAVSIDDVPSLTGFARGFGGDLHVFAHRLQAFPTATHKP